MRVTHKKHLPYFVLLLMRHDVYSASAHSRLNNEAKLAVFSLSDHDDIVRFRHMLDILD